MYGDGSSICLTWSATQFKLQQCFSVIGLLDVPMKALVCIKCSYNCDIIRC